MKFERYSRQILVDGFGISGQKKLAQSRILVVGAGGLGAACLPYLAGAGIGHICVLDADKIELSNLHRQVLYDEGDIGQLKAMVAAHKLSALNSQIVCDYKLQKLSAHNANKLATEFDLIVDCTDNYNAKYAISDACEAADIAMVSASIEGMSGYFGTFGGQKYANYRALFNEPSLNALNCAQSGVLGTVAGMFGLMQAHEVVKILSGVGEVNDKILMLDLFDFSMQKIALPQKYVSKFIPFNLQNHADIGAKQLLDVREEQEFAAGHFNNAINIPSIELAMSTDILAMMATFGLTKNAEYALYCASGARAQTAAIRLQRAGFANLTLLSEGFE